MSVRKRTWTTPKGGEKSAWVVDYIDQHGKRRLKTFPRKKEADAFRAKAEHEVGEGVHVADRATTTVAVAGETWVKAVTASSLEVGTVDQYRRHFRLHIKPYLGERRLNELTVPVIRAFQERLRAGDDTLPPDDPTRAARSAKMVKLATASLGRILSAAQDHGLVARNVVSEMARRPAPGARSEQRQKAKLRYGVDIPTVEEIRAIVAAAKGRHRPAIITVIFTGLRASELLGLKWDDVELDNARLHVRQRADRTRSLGAPKSQAGRREVPLPPLVVNTLREWRVACPRGPHALVFPTTRGDVQGYHNFIRDGFDPTQVAAGVTRDSGRRDDDGKAILAAKYGMHAMRHWYASWCINRRTDGGLELPAKIVQERLGHSSITMTLDTYGHLFPAQDHASSLAEAQRALLGA